MTGGWIKDHRKELESDIWMMPPLYHRVWQYLKYKVNHEAKTVPTRNGKVNIGKGQTITSLRAIAEAVKWVEWGVEKVPAAKTIREILKWLEAEEMIVRESNRKGTLITVRNYCVYQGSENEESNEQETKRKHGGPTNKNDKEKDTGEVGKNSPKEVIDYYHDSFIKKFGEKPIISGGKDAAIMKKIITSYGTPKTKELLDRFFESKDEFVINSGYTIGVFATQINKLITQAKPRKGLGDLK